MFFFPQLIEALTTLILTSSPIGVWKCNFPPGFSQTDDQATDQPADGTGGVIGRVVTLPKVCLCMQKYNI